MKGTKRKTIEEEKEELELMVARLHTKLLFFEDHMTPNEYKSFLHNYSTPRVKLTRPPKL